MYSTSDLSDLSGGLAQVCRSPLRNYGGTTAAAGTVACVQVAHAVGLVKAMLAEPGGGRILVVDGGGSLDAALLGDNMALSAMRNGWGAIVVNGAVRDASALRALAIGIWALGTCPRRGAASDAGVRDSPLHFGGVRFVPGQFLCADEDGLIVLEHPPA